ncbi:carbohydrate kinase [Polaribacter reichenbachii]|uniref:Carbohydrate kinase n=1 Tax=Polaribacter reichenbachii TaxID=996801 RepID=A0A1B8TNS3_9FLAO|nr:FGGY family carbohydrate kinase [Polaribacter reichenbachii]APZ46650.1 carbohydrate kinase [Polaribacter reichenbachii]AUC17293.1 carbohydrate kinase [Polaribacter reichenbachii]OBY61259.1 carbohydrate kinase [Polaribacter reichenbachii]
MYYIGYDLGSSSVKAALIDAKTGRTAGVTNYPEKEMAIIALETGWAEQDPEIWWKNIGKVTQKLLKQTSISSDKIIGIGIAYQMHGLVIVDENHKALRPSIIWCDSRAVKIGNDAFIGAGEDKCISNLLNSPGNFTLSKLKWVKENEPETFKKVNKLLLPGDFIALKLTGEATTTISGLSEGMMWDFKQNKPAEWLFNYMGISTNLIPTILPTFSNQGKVTKQAAKETGLPQGIPVLYRAGDQPNNALSLNVLHPGEIAATGGTSGVVYAVTDKTDSKESVRINNFAHVNYTEETPRIGKLLNINGAGIQYSWMKNNLASTDTYNNMNELASQVPVGSDGLRIIPFGNGAERMLNNTNNGASIFNLNFNKHKNEHLFRAALEGIAFAFVYGISILKNDGVNLSGMRAGSDNLFRSEIFSKTIATLIETEINIIDTTGAIGAARAAGVANKDFKNLEEVFSDNEQVLTYHPLNDKQIYKDAYNLWKNDLEKKYNN